MDKIWIVENSSGKSVFHTEDRFNNYITSGYLSDSRIRIYDLSSDMSSREYKEEIKGEFKRKMREIRLDTLLDSDRSPEEIGDYETIKSMTKLVDTISEYLKSLSEKGEAKYLHNYNYIRNLFTVLNNILDMCDIKLFKKKIINNRIVIMYDILNSIEDYKNVLKIHNFRSLPNKKDGTKGMGKAYESLL